MFSVARICLLLIALIPAGVFRSPPRLPGSAVTRPTVRQDPPVHLGPVFDDVDRARRITFVIEAKGSMLVKWSCLKDELNRVIATLSPEQAFDIVCLQPDGCEQLSPASLPASAANAARAASFLDSVTVAGYTDPIPAIDAAFNEKPDVIYLLADGDFPDNDLVLKKIQEKKLRAAVKIYTVAYLGEADLDSAFIDLFKTLARETKGHFKHVKARDL